MSSVGGDDDSSQLSAITKSGELLPDESLPGDSFTSRETDQIQRFREMILAYFVLGSVGVGISLYYSVAEESPKTNMVLHIWLGSSSDVKLTGQTCVSLFYATFILELYFLFRRYDNLVQERQQKLLRETQRSHQLVTSLFPADVSRRLMVEVDNNPKKKKKSTTTTMESQESNKEDRYDNKNDQLHGFWNRSSTYESFDDFDTVRPTSKPIADFFPDVTIMICDLVGFTAWSSTREPALVFTLLESIYFEFDQIARQLGVFKVETIGDCYVAVAGLPEPRDDHAIVMARFAEDCRKKFHIVVLELEKFLGPDTADLETRTGLHSGPITAGVLRGDRARFQLFGDTMNTASRIETTGKPGMIHVSNETAELLICRGKDHWIEPREDKVHAKGKGEMSTFWLVNTKEKSKRNSLCNMTMHCGSSPPVETRHRVMNYEIPAKHLRLVDWIATELATLLKDVFRSRKGRDIAVQRNSELILSLEQETLSNPKLPRDEIVEIIDLPEFPVDTMPVDEEDVELNDQLLAELHDYVLAIAQAYPLSNPFHTFEHASHVTMSCCKLLSRMVPRDVHDEVGSRSAYDLHQQTHGISSDPLSRFSVVLSALIHDVDHPGVPNSILFQENHQLTERYSTSPSEQNSIDFSWRLLQEERFSILRSAIYATPEEFHRFRQILINVVMSTDIADQDLEAERDSRWERAYVHGEEELKGTITLEHILQASDVVHAMQHWHVYRKWNGLLFEETNQAYQQGRLITNPFNYWYEGELDFFDNHILPLAEKLNQAGVFGVSGQELLNYALANKKEWSLFGRGVVTGMRRNSLGSTSTASLQSLKSPKTSPVVGSFHSPTGRRLKSFKVKLGNNGVGLSIVPPIHDDTEDFELPEVLSVLVADDDIILRKLFVRSVQEIAPLWTIVEADSGEQTLAYITAEGTSAFDLIFIDHYLGTDESNSLGSDIVYELRKRGCQDTTICGMSCNDVEYLFSTAGADAFCSKPLKFHAASMKTELGRVLGLLDDSTTRIGGTDDEESFCGS